MSISLIVYLILFVAGIVIWKKNNDKRYFWYLFPVGGLIILSVLQYLLDTYLQFSESQGVIEFFIFTALRVVAFIVLLLITLRKTFK
jgi:hypothetical protein